MEKKIIISGDVKIILDEKFANYLVYYLIVENA